jgi:hypothetical protein
VAAQVVASRAVLSSTELVSFHLFLGLPNGLLCSVLPTRTFVWERVNSFISLKTDEKPQLPLNNPKPWVPLTEKQFYV